MDVAAMAAELSDRILGGFMGKAYQQSSDRIWLSVQSPAEGRLDLLLVAGRRINITRAERPASKTPPQFPTMLRNRLSGGRIVQISQHDFDRVLEIAVERSGARHYLVIELFPKGSMVLLDENRQILSMLRKMVYRGSKMAAGEKYLFHPGQLDPRTISLEDLSGWLSSAGQDLVRSLVRGLNMGGTYGEEVCLVAGVAKNRPAADLNASEVERVHQALRQVFLDDTLDPHIVLSPDGGEPVDVLSRPLRVYEKLPVKRYATFSEAVDAFFVEKEAAAEVRQDPLDRRIDLQKKAVEEFEAQEKALIARGELVYQLYGGVDKILNVVAAAHGKGFSYNEIWERISGSDLPSARAILSLDGQGEMRAIVGDAELELHAGLTVPQNAQRYYEKAKEMARKAAGARVALKITMELKAGKSAPRKSRPSTAPRRRKPKWYERFRWFYSSDGFLVLGGRDADSNEEIYAKYLEKRDLAMHTDAPGAPLTVIKTGGEDVPESTLIEAAQFAVSFSSIWKGGLAAADCYLVKGDQVSKTPESGEFLKKGAFVIRGERRYFKDTPLALALGISEGQLIGGPVSAVLPRADPSVEVEPGELNADDLAKRIYRFFSEKEEDRAYLKSIASVDQIVQFLPPGGSRVKGSSG